MRTSKRTKNTKVPAVVFLRAHRDSVGNSPISEASLAMGTSMKLNG